MKKINIDDMPKEALEKLKPIVSSLFSYYLMEQGKHGSNIVAV